MQIFGRLEAFFETGTEGVVWSLVDHGLPGYDGLWPLQFGDHLDVLDADGETLWQGIIKLEYANRKVATHYQQEVFGYWVNGLQDGEDAETWAKLFFDRERAILTPAAPSEARIPPHPFWGPSDTLADRLRALPEERQEALFHMAMYPWLYFLSDSTPFSLAIRDWGFTSEETVRLLGGLPDQMPFTFDGLVRIALLCGAYGGLDWNCPTREARIAWLNDGTPSPKELLLNGEFAQVRDRVEIVI